MQSIQFPVKPLLAINSPLYLKRLVRALNQEAMAGNGFLAGFHGRCLSAKFTHGEIMVRQTSGEWIYATHSSFSSVSSGEEIAASRVP